MKEGRRNWRIISAGLIEVHLALEHHFRAALSKKGGRVWSKPRRDTVATADMS